jgi:hypothetical protein
MANSGIRFSESEFWEIQKPISRCGMPMSMTSVSWPAATSEEGSRPEKCFLLSLPLSF